MSRKLGAKNITGLVDRTTVSTSAGSSAPVKSRAPLDQFLSLLRNQENLLKWIQSRHDALTSISRNSATQKHGPKGPKSETFRKYSRHIEQLGLLEGINAFEVFYKRTVIALGEAIQECVPLDGIKDKVEARVLWSLASNVSVPALVFEGQLFHDLDVVDRATKMLIGKPRYNSSQPLPAMKDIVRSIQAVFQVRHTLSHNAGMVTPSDSIKFKVLGFTAKAGESIDPSRGDFGRGVFKLLKQEATEFTEWLRKATIEFLATAEASRGIKLPAARKPELMVILGGKDADWNTVHWT
jgi:hypothetical protein